jgi:hypothetical protein
MKNNQKGFGVVEALVIVLILGLVGFGGWFIWNKNQTNGQSNGNGKDAKSINDAGGKEQESYIVPKSYKVYENTELGIKLAYPEVWDAPQMATNANATLAALLSDETIASTGNVKGGLQIFSSQTQEFEVSANYKGAMLEPEASDGKTVWKVKTAGLEDVVVGSVYAPAPRVLYEKDNLKVYEFPASHASGAWATLAFAVNDNFVGIATPLFNPSDGIGQEEFDARRASFNDTLAEVAKTIRIL